MSLTVLVATWSVTVLLFTARTVVISNAQIALGADGSEKQAVDDNKIQSSSSPEGNQSSNQSSPSSDENKKRVEQDEKKLQADVVHIQANVTKLQASEKKQVQPDVSKLQADMIKLVSDDHYYVTTTLESNQV